MKKESLGEREKERKKEMKKESLEEREKERNGERELWRKRASV